jgi:hypothetical protein
MPKIFPRAEYDDRDDTTWRSDTYRELEWIRRERGWGAGWTKWKFRELFGSWPPKYLESSTPMPASEALQKWVRCGINAWVRERKKHENAGATLLSGVAETKRAGKQAGTSSTVEAGAGTPDMEGWYIY